MHRTRIRNRAGHEPVRPGTPAVRRHAAQRDSEGRRFAAPQACAQQITAAPADRATISRYAQCPFLPRAAPLRLAWAS
ncbi:hypothetical protein Sya03_04790 [Spirilliplanes yamanashiensis]|uniref:Uncharacterized protein n=1 Tax=Spirilliplanes yamanashiensis TaxID=42233 RepID=A0A8J3Y467_9ACTN|nr:hypothetical protein Sya03_04790 [Spirilliplanes yamanashiensis]